jgi:formate dehydrogenase major subunit
MANSDCILIQGSNMAECHPVAFQWVVEAKQRGAKVIHVDPRFTRTSALADLHVPLRAGSDIVLLGALINHVLERERYFKEYVVRYTNAPMLIREDFVDTEDLDGLFSGFDPEHGTYDAASWQYAGTPDPGHAEGEHESETGQQFGGIGAPTGAEQPPERDETLQHPRCVFQLLRRHFRRYTPELVEQVCGVPPTQFRQVAELLCDNSGRERTTSFAYAVGWTQHSNGAQYIRTAAILQLLLGNIGRPGGGIMALRGHAAIQGSSDIPTLYNLLPGYLPMANAAGMPDLAAYLEQNTKKGGFWGHTDAYLISLLKAWWGEAATADNDWCFDYLPRISGDHSTYRTILDMLEGKVKGFFLLGENPAVGSSNSRLQRLAMAKLDWLVVRDLVEIESASFWYDAPEIESGELRTADIGTEVFFLPAASHVEKEGSFTNTQRLLQWREKALDPKGDCRSELWFMYHLGQLIRRRLAGSADPKDRPVLDLTWDYPTHGPHGDPDAEAVLREINGWGPDGRALSAFTQLRADGSTACGCWIYCGCYAEEVNQAARRKPRGEQDWVAAEWGWAWPANRRILYNRASADPDGRPWSERKRYVWWDEGAGRWVGYDEPDFPRTKRPDYRPPDGAQAEDANGGDEPFIMQPDGRGALFVPSGLQDGPLPTHYEPRETPVRSPLYGQQHNPTRQEYAREGNRYHPAAPDPADDAYPYVFTTYRLTEHHTAGGMSRFQPYLSELQPEMFCEVSPALAAERGLEHGGWATIVTARTAIEARVLVTDRIPPLKVRGRTVHQVGLPYHWGSRGLVTGDSANDLLPIVLDPNVQIQESKAATCDIRPGRRPRGVALPALVADYRARAGLEGDAHEG